MLQRMDARETRGWAAATNGAAQVPVIRKNIANRAVAGLSKRPYNLRHPDKSDGAAIWDLVNAGGALDLNSAYSYLMLGEYFADTCRVAYRGSRLAGFVAGFVPPRRPDTLFVWQIGVDPREQGRGLGKRLLRDLLGTPACGHLRYLEATVTPSNMPSERLFRGIAKDFEISCRVEDVFAGHDFPGEGHEGERRFRIGPLPKVGRALPTA